MLCQPNTKQDLSEYFLLLRLQKASVIITLLTHYYSTELNQQSATALFRPNRTTRYSNNSFFLKHAKQYDKPLPSGCNKIIVLLHKSFLLTSVGNAQLLRVDKFCVCVCVFFTKYY